ncbi:MAG: acetyl-CoA carboxylase biotin carboxyl carrier protein [Proteobacteria bacterium]|nr:acetyl-CoA carboxylase biotin carboxyl carrier protein [Pseudomonadota bacterium]
MATAKKKAGAKSPERRSADKRVRDLAMLLQETGLSEIEIEERGTRIRVVAAGHAGAPGAATGAAPVAVAPVAAAAEGQPATADEATGSHPGTLLSPMVGTAFVATEPGADPFVRVGDQVNAGQTVLIIEAMKVMNSIPAPKAGKVIEIMISDAEPVEFGQPLLVIE